MEKVTKVKKRSFVSRVARDWQLIVFCLVPIAYFFIIHYVPMYGVQIAFKEFVPSKGIWGSPWVGFEQFRRFFSSYMFKPVIKNTLTLSFLQILISFPMPIIMAILLSKVPNKRYSKFAQTVFYIPHFISIVVLTSMLYIFLSPRNGVVNNIIRFFGGEPIFFLGEPHLFKWNFILSGIWQNTGWNAIIYISALAAIDPALYEAAKVDGANQWKMIWHIDLPGLLPTIMMMLILAVGRVMNIGFQKAYLMQNTQNLVASEIISTYIYKVGLLDTQYSYSAAINLFNNLINIILLVSVNRMSKAITKHGVF